eukprot:scaffold2750_cov380-Prasinococcus_capsulatus_cf.AAC.2
MLRVRTASGTAHVRSPRLAIAVREAAGRSASHDAPRLTTWNVSAAKHQGGGGGRCVGVCDGRGQPSGFPTTPARAPPCEYVNCRSRLPCTTLSGSGPRLGRVKGHP